MDNQILDALKQRFGYACSVSNDKRNTHSNTVTGLKSQPPDAVLDCTCEDDVIAAVKLAIEYKFPIIPFGAGSSLEGQTNCPFGGLSLSMSPMNSIKALQLEDMQAVVEPGVTRRQLNDYLRDTGLQFTVDPGADATIGGMCSTGASGTTTVAYGGMRENVKKIRFVDGLANVVTVGYSAPKSAAGYDILPLIIGSEGTLGVFTEITVKLHPRQEDVLGVIVNFPDEGAAISAVSTAISSGIKFTRVEYLDAVSIRACNNYSGLDYPETPHIFAEFQDFEEVAKYHAEKFISIANGNEGASELAVGDQNVKTIWGARHDAWWAIHSLYRGKQGITSDACVPLSKLADSIKYARSLLLEFKLDGAIIGHVGDGNFHVLIMHDSSSSTERLKVDQYMKTIGSYAISVGGTSTGEHGIGQGKIDLLAKEHPTALPIMRTIKSSFDPYGIFNPGKLFIEKSMGR